MSSEDTEALI